MIVSYKWLQEYFDAPLPPPEKVAELFIFHAFEVESVEEKNGDFIFDLKVLPDRAHDCLSHRGVARELGAMLSIPLSDKRKVKNTGVVDGNFSVTVQRDNFARFLQDLLIEPLQNRHHIAPQKPGASGNKQGLPLEHFDTLSKRFYNNIYVL